MNNDGANFLCQSTATREGAPASWITVDGRRACSFCGSMHPDDYMAAMLATLDPEDPTYIDPTTKRYKWYVCKGEWRGKFYSWHYPDAEWVAKANELHPHVTRFSTTKMNRQVDAAFEAMKAQDNKEQQDG